ncbi:MAG: T9SS type A sorting domain-containing protein [Bacteroidota bacterium]|nr:T9SS type A sorting domain-containing protein [Bacteroidota bacterium]
MIRFNIIPVLLVCFVSFPGLNAQKLIPNNNFNGVCYAGTRINRIYIPPPKEALRRAEAKGGGMITVIYSGFPAEARDAVAYAVNILEGMLPADLDMTLRASWTKISDSGILGNSSITGFAAGWAINALDPRSYYPISVAEKISGKNINKADEADVELILNSSSKWYFGTDGNTPTTKYDLVTVVLHELCHGLGFFDSMNYDGSQGSYGINTFPVIYDTFVEDLNGNRLTDTTIFKQHSLSLGSELVGGQLYFNGPLTKNYLAGSRARLYAPSEWDPGSSVSHLDELRTEQVNSLMTPFIDFGEAIHDPGKLTMSILGDLGWINTRIITESIKDTEEHLSEIYVKTEIKSDISYNSNLVGLAYSFDDFNTSDTIYMVHSGSSDDYACSIPVTSYNVKLNYFLFATDGFLRTYRSPSLADKAPYTVFIGIDTVRPVIQHTKKDYFFEKVDTIPFVATVTDNLGIDTVFVEYKVNNQPAGYFGMNLTDKDRYERNLNVRPELLKGGDSLNYRIFAIDRASGRNTRIYPSSGYLSVKIESLLPVLKSYSTDFSDAQADFYNSGFEITQPAYFSSPGLHSEHPYQSPDQDNKTLEFSSVFRHPVIFDASGMVISFREVVLVEPGEEGSVFGFSDFYDYVIVEASKDYGRNWFPLADGYDSRIVPAWEIAWNNSVITQNSSALGKESMMVGHTLYPRISNKISGGDSLLVRFRLFSDPYAHGWGWAIDDLKINPLVDKVEEIESLGLKIFPNPGNGLINLEFAGGTGMKTLMINIVDISGRKVMQKLVSDDSNTMLDITECPHGLYFIQIVEGRDIKVLKYSLIK